MTYIKKGLLAYASPTNIQKSAIDREFNIPILGAVAMVGGLDFEKIEEEYYKKAEDSFGLKRLYYLWKGKSSKRKYKECLTTIEKFLQGEGLKKELTLHFLDVRREKGFYIPDEILQKMELSPRTDFKDDEKVGKLLEGYFKK